MESFSKTSCGRTGAEASRELKEYTVSETGFAISNSRLKSPSPLASPMAVELISTRSTPLVDIDQLVMITSGGGCVFHVVVVSDQTSLGTNRSSNCGSEPAAGADTECSSRNARSKLFAAVPERSKR